MAQILLNAFRPPSSISWIYILIGTPLGHGSFCQFSIGGTLIQVKLFDTKGSQSLQAFSYFENMCLSCEMQVGTDSTIPSCSIRVAVTCEYPYIFTCRYPPSKIYIALLHIKTFACLLAGEDEFKQWLSL